MHPAIPPAALALAAAAAMAVYVGLRREKSGLHWLLLSVLGSLMVWSAGNISRYSVTTEPGLVVSLRIIFVGVLAAPPLWLLLAARYARLRAMLEPRVVFAALIVPSVLAYIALLTNETHHLLLRKVSIAGLTDGDWSWAGPGFWALLVWAYACVLGGVAIYLAMARQMLASNERRSGSFLALAAILPLVSSTAYLFRSMLPVPYDVTPTALTFSLVLLSAAVFRYRLLESLPLARRDVIEHLCDGVIVANATGEIVDLNPAAERILGRVAGALRQRPLADALAEHAREGEGPALREALARLGASAQPVTAELSTGDDRYVQVSAACVRDGGGEPAGRFAVLRDRTEEQRYEWLIRQTQRLESVGTLAAGVAHEVNNPLAFIRSNLGQIHRMGELVEEYRDGPEAKLAEELCDLREIAEETLDGIARIERIVSDMRLLSTPREQAFVSVDANEVVQDAIRLANLRDDPRIEVKIELDDGLPLVEGSSQRLVQAVLNLLVNARQALEGAPEGRIHVETSCDGDAVVIRVCDNGPGIAEEIQERIFDPFFTTKSPHQGTGLGLAIAFDILRNHGGVLELRQRSGLGATFAARLPIP
jgi:PAS domain S-box-containing protein